MSRTAPGAPAPDPAAVRPLPPRPSLEFERKHAKKLLALLRQCDGEALERARRQLKSAASRRATGFKLADAQFTIAREYGFQSWPRLVEYFRALDRHERSGARDRYLDPRTLEFRPRAILAEHRDRRAGTAQCLAAFIPRFYGLTIEEVFAAEVTIDDARLVHARMNRFPSWQVMLEATQRPAPNDWERHSSPGRMALRAMHAGDARQFAEIVNAHPDLLTESTPGQPGCIALASAALRGNLREQTSETPRIIEWLKARMDLTSTLNWMLLGHWNMPTGSVQLLLDLGANPLWVPPNGIRVLEHAIARYWNADAVDLIAARVSPPKAFWVAAGLGDVKAVERYLDRNGAPTATAHKRRPDFTAMEMGFLPLNPGADDRTVIWEAFLVAALNQRLDVMDVLLDRGFPVDYSGWGQTILHLAVGNGWIPLLEYLIGRGADLDLKGWHPHLSARELAEHGFLNPHGHPEKRRILELCGGRDPEVLQREHDTQRAKRVMATHPSVEEAFEFAKHDATRQGLSAVSPENLFIALLHQGKLPLSILAGAEVDIARLREAVATRLVPPEGPAPADMTADAECTAVLMAARAEAERRKHDTLSNLHVFLGLLASAPAAVTGLIEPPGGSLEKIRAFIEREFSNW